MKLHILTDMHIEFGSFDPPEIDADLVVLAKDLTFPEIVNFFVEFGTGTGITLSLEF